MKNKKTLITLKMKTETKKGFQLFLITQLIYYFLNNIDACHAHI